MSGPVDAIAKRLFERCEAHAPGCELRLLVEEGATGALVLRGWYGREAPARLPVHLPPGLAGSAVGRLRGGARAVRLRQPELDHHVLLARLLGVAPGGELVLLSGGGARLGSVLAVVSNAAVPALSVAEALQRELATLDGEIRNAVWAAERSGWERALARVQSRKSASELAGFCVAALKGVVLASVLGFDPVRGTFRSLGLAAQPGKERRLARYLGHEAPAAEFASAAFLEADAPTELRLSTDQGPGREREAMRTLVADRGAVELLALPLREESGALEGSLVLYGDQPGFRPEDLAALVSVASEMLEGRGLGARQISPIFHLTEVIAAEGMDLERILDEIVSEMRAFIGAQACAVALLDEATGRLLLSRRDGYGDAAPLALPIPDQDDALGPRSIAGHVVRTGEPHLAGDTRQSEYFFDTGEGFRCEMVAPLKVGNRVLGAVVASHRRPEHFREADLERLQVFAGQVAWAVEDAQLLSRARAREQATAQRQRAAHGAARAASQLEYHFGGLIGDPAGPMGEVYRRIGRIVRDAEDWATVLITGETGTGKEAVAFALHRASSRAERSMLTTNFAAFGGDPNLIQSELFGHEKGAFTGAVSPHRGCFERADGTTLFLDEVGDIVPAVQAKLLRVLQAGRRKEFERLGGQASLRSDVRVVAATNKPLSEEVRTGRFRQDLFYRLNTLRIHLPPLRERPRDLRALAIHFAAQYADQSGTALLIDEAAFELLPRYDWPGNVRQLGAVIRRAAVLFGEAGRITREDLALALADEPGAALEEASSGNTGLYARVVAAGDGAFWKQVHAPFRDRALTRDALRDLVDDALTDTGGYYRAAARNMGVADDDYARFMDFLRHADARLDFRPYRRGTMVSSSRTSTRRLRSS